MADTPRDEAGSLISALNDLVGRWRERGPYLVAADSAAARLKDFWSITDQLMVVVSAAIDLAKSPAPTEGELKGLRTLATDLKQWRAQPELQAEVSTRGTRAKLTGTSAATLPALLIGAIVYLSHLYTTTTGGHWVLAAVIAAFTLILAGLILRRVGRRS